MSTGTAYAETRSLLRRRWSAEEFQSATRLGIFRPEERLELLDGEILEKMPPDPPHSSATGLLDDVLRRAFAGVDCFVRTENPIVLPQASQPEPDAAVVRGARRDYLQQHPMPGDLLLVVEVSFPTLADDRGIKARLYAEAGIAEYWIVNLRDRQLEVHRSPRGGIWTQTFVVAVGASVAPLAAPSATVPVDDLLP